MYMSIASAVARKAQINKYLLILEETDYLHEK